MTPTPKTPSYEGVVFVERSGVYKCTILWYYAKITHNRALLMSIKSITMHHHITHVAIPSVTRFLPALVAAMTLFAAAFAYALPASAQISDGAVFATDANLVRGLANAEYGFEFETQTAATASAITITFPSGYGIASGTIDTEYIRCGEECTEKEVITVGTGTVDVESIVGSSTARTITITLAEDTELDAEGGVTFVLTRGITNPTVGGFTGFFGIMTNAVGETAQTDILGVVITPSPATGPTPANGASKVATTTSLTWGGGEGATYYVVYLATRSGLREAHKVGTTTARTFTPEKPLDVNTNYYWRIDSVNQSGVTEGTRWVFRTGTAAEQPVKDDPVTHPERRVPPGLAKKGPVLISEQRLMELMEHVRGLQVAATKAPPHSAVGRAAFLRDLMYGAEGDDVQELQRFLNEHGFVVSATGPGSVGNETRYFGPATRAAVQRYQEAHGITPSAGYFGPKTRAHAETKRDNKDKGND